MRKYSLFFGSALAVVVTFVAFSERGKPEPTGAEMKLPFSQFFSKMEARHISEAQVMAFEKHSCRWSDTLSGHICKFSYSMASSAGRLSVLPARGTVSGTFFRNAEGILQFETVIG